MVGSLCCPRDFQKSSPTPQFKGINSSALSFLYSLTLTSIPEKATAKHSHVLAWKIPGTVEPGGMPSMGSHRVGHDWSNLAAAAAAHLYMTTGKTIDLTRLTFVGKVMALPFNMMSRFIITFLPRSKHLLISWVQSPYAAILEPQKIKSLTVSIFSPSNRHKLLGPDVMILVFLSFLSFFFFSFIYISWRLINLQ